MTRTLFGKPKGISGRPWTAHKLRKAVVTGAASLLLGLLGPMEARAAVANKAEPVLDTPADVKMEFTGFVGERLKANL